MELNLTSLLFDDDDDIALFSSDAVWDFVSIASATYAFAVHLTCKASNRVL